MPPPLALILCLAFIAYAMRQDIRESRGLSWGIWVPFFWIALSASKPLPYWLNPQLSMIASNWTNIPTIDFAAGSALDRDVLLIMIGLGLIILYKRREHFRFDVRDNAWLLVLFGFMLISATWSQFPALTIKRWIRTGGDLVMVLIILTESNERESFERIIRRCAIVLLPLSFVFIRYFRNLGIGYDPWGFSEIVGVTNQKNQLGILCAFVGFLIFWRIIKQLPRLNYLDVCLLVLAVAVLLMSRSATSIIVMIAGVLILVLLIALRRSKRKPTAPLAAVIVTVILVQLFMAGVPGDSLQTRFFSATGRDTSLTGRVPLWKDVIVIGMQRPIQGYGYGGFWFSRLSTTLWTKHSSRPMSGHNGYIDIFIDLGLVGLFLFIFLLSRVYRKVVAAIRDKSPFEELSYALLIMIALHNLTESTFIKAVSFLWIMFLFLATTIRKSPVTASPVSDGRPEALA